MKLKIKVITRKTSPIPFAERIEKLNELMRGWVHYFKHATGYQKLKDLDSWLRSRLRYCIYERMVRSKKGLIDLFNEVNRERVGWLETP